MADIDEPLSVIDKKVHYRQAISPNHQSGSFAGEDQDNHDFRFSARGKKTITVAVDNPTDKDMTWSLYGLHAADGDVGDAGTFEVDVANTASAGGKDTATNSQAFPWYLLRCSFAADPDGSTVRVYISANS